MVKVEFIDDDHFTIFYINGNFLRTEEEIKTFFKYLNKKLKKDYDYEFIGFYTVNIYECGNLMVMDFFNIDDYGRTDFDITFIINSVMLFEFDDYDMVPGEKIYYRNKYYVELEEMVDNSYLFEYGNVVYGDNVKEILNCGKIVN